MIYLDYQATTPCDRRVADRIHATLTTEFGNASSVDHEVGDRAAAAIHHASQQLAALVDCSPRQILYTSGATESLNLAIQGTVQGLETQGRSPIRVASSAVEHKAVLDVCGALAQQGRIEWRQIPVDGGGQIALEQVEHCCRQGLELLVVMAANNEVGTIYPVAEMAGIAQRYAVPFLCDATQAVGKIPLQFEAWGITMLALSGHKLYGPPGVGALVVRRDHRLAPLWFGGGQQRGVRPGTLNLAGIVGLGEACRLRGEEMAADEGRIAELRDRFQARLCDAIPNLVVNGDQAHRLAGSLHVAIPDLPNSAVIARVRHRVAIATGSACTSGIETPSHVLRAMGLPASLQDGALRISLGKFTTSADIDTAGDILMTAIQAVQRLL